MELVFALSKIKPLNSHLHCFQDYRERNLRCDDGTDEDFDLLENKRRAGGLWIVFWTLFIVSLSLKSFCFKSKQERRVDKISIKRSRRTPVVGIALVIRKENLTLKVGRIILICLWCAFVFLDVGGRGQVWSGSRTVHASASCLTEKERGSQCAFNDVVL